MLEKIINGDRDVMFSDWGREAVFRVVDQRFVEESQVIEEVFTDLHLSCLVSGDEDEQTFAAAGQHLTEMIRVVFKSEELPGVVDWSVCRVVLDSDQFQVVTVEESDGVLEFGCRKLN